MKHELENDLGNFEGFNFRNQGAIFPNHSAQEVLDWDHDAKGEAEFWPDGEHSGVCLVFRGESSVDPGELIALDNLITALGDGPETYVKIAYLKDQGESLTTLTQERIEDAGLYIFSGLNFVDTRKEAAFSMFEDYYPEEYRIWEKSTCPGLHFDWERFLDGPEFSASEYQVEDEKFVVVKSL